MLAFYCTKSAAPGEARTHNPGITFCTVYKYRALTDCATGAHWQKGSLQGVSFERNLVRHQPNNPWQKELLQGVGFEPTQSYDYESLNLTP